MATITRFEDLEIWQLARELSKEVYELTFVEPIKSDFRLKDQMVEVPVQSWIILLRDLKEAVNWNL